ncbi:MAG: HlyD family efflux transporter periplasmic adaptor subunit [Candidatus Pacebacteria bacterium]|nr:HlyD family efflux transporter periplasmic adaptor subunit [Candidatus Paceibacterota bacterium]
MKKFVKNNKKKIVIGLVVLAVMYKIAIGLKSEIPEPQTAEQLVVDIFTINEHKTKSLETLCSVNASSDIAVIPESSGKVKSVFVKDGSVVKKGQKLFSMENIQQQVTVGNAKVSVKSAELALSDLLKKNDASSKNSILNQTISQQKTFVENARNAYLNHDLTAYPEDFDETSGAPIISGNYTCDNEGVYNLDIYGSAADSGASVRLSGLETGRFSVSTDYAVPMGNCGLEISFPSNFKKNKIWTIAIPNIRSSSHFASKKTYEAALSGKDININRIEISPEQISRARAQVSQARLQLSSAYDMLSKTVVRAAVSGTLSGFNVNNGDFTTAFSEIARIKSVGDLELVSYINADERDYIFVGNKAYLEGSEITVTEVSPTIDTQTKKIKITLDVGQENNLVEGTEVSCHIDRVFSDNDIAEKDGKVIPLSAISIIGQNSYVFEIIENKAYKKIVEVGALLGQDVIVYGLESEIIIRDARAVRDGQELILK